MFALTQRMLDFCSKIMKFMANSKYHYYGLLKLYQNRISGKTICNLINVFIPNSLKS